MKKKKVTVTGSATWTIEYNPIYMAECPHCKAMLIMGRPSFIQKLVAWAKQIKTLK